MVVVLVVVRYHATLSAAPLCLCACTLIVHATPSVPNVVCGGQRWRGGKKLWAWTHRCTEAVSSGVLPCVCVALRTHRRF